MDMALTLIYYAAVLALFVCTIIVIIKMFQNKQTGLGIATILTIPCIIGYILALIFGWKNKQAWGLQTVMPILTLSFLAALGSGAVVVPKIIADTQNQMKQIQDQVKADMEKMQQQQGAPNFGTLPAEPAPQP